MPSQLKDRPTGGLGRLLAALRPARAGPLPVQTGFPTSLADLVVKNHGRLKKPSSSSAYSRHKKRSHSPSPSPSAPASPPPPPPVAAVLLPTQPKPDFLPARASRQHKGAAFGLGLGFLALGGMASLALLVMWSKKVVVAVTVVSFSLFLLESLRSTPAPRQPRPRDPQATTKLDLDGRGCVSPIREVGLEAEKPSFSDSDKGSEIGNGLSDPKAKKKKISWRKLIVKKLQKGKKSKEIDSSSSCHCKSNRVDAELDVITMEVDSSGSCCANGNVMDAEVDTNARSIRIKPSVDLTDKTSLELRIEEEGGERVFPLVVVVAVILLGLVAGKLPAVGLTVFCFGFFCSIQRLPGDGGAVPGR